MTKPLRIALVRQRYTPFGGAERFMERTLTALAAEGTRLTVVTRAWPEQAGIAPQRCDPFYLGRLWRDRGFSRCACRRIRAGAYDLVQSHERMPCCDVYRAGDGVHREWLRQRQRIHGPLGWLTQWLSPYHRYLLRAEAELFASPRLRAVICNSAMVKAEILHHYAYPADRIHVIYSGVDGNRFSPELKARYRQETRERHRIPLSVPLLLFVGSGFQRKGLGPLLLAMASLPPQTHLLVIGKDRHSTRFRRIGRRLGLGTRVRFLGPQGDVAPYYGAADLVVLPSLYDPFPNVVLEAMATGLPVVTGIKSGAIDLIRDGDNGFTCDPLQRTGLIEAIRPLLEPGVREAIGARARETVLPLTTEAMAHQLLALYRRLLAARPP
jgi:UDP-glucose:(heptosyl)LPS alpha-1,3-glucosyltransferase